MARDWRTEYEGLKSYISDNPEIILSTTEISIPQNLRDEFYLRFDRIRSAFVETHYSELPVDLDALCTHYLQVEKEVRKLLGIESISMPMDLYSILHTPKDGLTRVIYNRLFDLLQGKTTIDAFERQCADDLKTSSADLFRLGYEWWAGLVLIKLLDPDQAFAVDLDPEYKPILAELKEISFGRQAHHPTIRIPEFVLHSRKLGKYVAVKMAITREVESYTGGIKPAVRPKKRTGDTSFALDSRVMLLSFMSVPEKIPIVADIYEQTLTSPDWMLECITQEEFRDSGALDEVKQRVDTMKPTLGMCLLVLDQGAEAPLQAIAENIRPVSVGFDQSKLQPVIASLGIGGEPAPS
jgi:hypothetical protein